MPCKLSAALGAEWADWKSVRRFAHDALQRGRTVLAAGVRGIFGIACLDDPTALAAEQHQSAIESHERDHGPGRLLIKLRRAGCGTLHGDYRLEPVSQRLRRRRPAQLHQRRMDRVVRRPREGRGDGLEQALAGVRLRTLNFHGGFADRRDGRAEGPPGWCRWR